MKRLIAVVVGVVVVATAGLVPAQAAAPQKIPSTVKLRFNDVQFAFNGRVNSVDRCEKARSVTVFRVEEGDDAVIGSDKTDSGGRYSVDINVVQDNNDYYSKAAKRSPNEKTICKAARSKNLFLDLDT